MTGVAVKQASQAPLQFPRLVHNYVSEPLLHRPAGSMQQYPRHYTSSLQGGQGGRTTPHDPAIAGPPTDLHFPFLRCASKPLERRASYSGEPLPGNKKGSRSARGHHPGRRYRVMRSCSMAETRLEKSALSQDPTSTCSSPDKGFDTVNMAANRPEMTAREFIRRMNRERRLREKRLMQLQQKRAEAQIALAKKHKEEADEQLRARKEQHRARMKEIKQRALIRQATLKKERRRSSEVKKQNYMHKPLWKQLVDQRKQLEEKEKMEQIEKALQDRYRGRAIPTSVRVKLKKATSKTDLKEENQKACKKFHKEAKETNEAEKIIKQCFRASYLSIHHDRIKREMQDQRQAVRANFEEKQQRAQNKVDYGSQVRRMSLSGSQNTTYLLPTGHTPPHPGYPSGGSSPIQVLKTQTSRSDGLCQAMLEERKKSLPHLYAQMKALNTIMKHNKNIVYNITETEEAKKAKTKKSMYRSKSHKKFMEEIHKRREEQVKSRELSKSRSRQQINYAHQVRSMSYGQYLNKAYSPGTPSNPYALSREGHRPSPAFCTIPPSNGISDPAQAMMERRRASIPSLYMQMSMLDQMMQRDSSSQVLRPVLESQNAAGDKKLFKSKYYTRFKQEKVAKAKKRQETNIRAKKKQEYGEFVRKRTSVRLTPSPKQKHDLQPHPPSPKRFLPEKQNTYRFEVSLRNSMSSLKTTCTYKEGGKQEPPMPPLSDSNDDKVSEGGNEMLEQHGRDSSTETPRNSFCTSPIKASSERAEPGDLLNQALPRDSVKLDDVEAVKNGQGEIPSHSLPFSPIQGQTEGFKPTATPPKDSSGSKPFQRSSFEKNKQLRAKINSSADCGERVLTA